MALSRNSAGVGVAFALSRPHPPDLRREDQGGEQALHEDVRQLDHAEAALARAKPQAR
jgi:hypothetical protein